jgi:DNA end-binding protein Ku
VRATWSGAITFGLITIPVRLYTAVSDKKVDLHLVHEKDGERIHYKRVCDKGHEVEWDEIVRGHEVKGKGLVTISDEELDALDAESMRSIDVDTFVPLDDIDPIYYDKTYYIGPDAAGVKAYKLLIKALDAEGLVGIAKVAIRERERLSAIRIKDKMLVLETMHWPDEIRAADLENLDKSTRISDREMKMARQLVQQLAGKFEPSRYEDEYRVALEELIRKKAKGEEIIAPEAPEKPAEVTDLMEALKASVEAARSGKKKSTRKKTTRKKSAPKKKSTARKKKKTTAKRKSA